LEEHSVVDLEEVSWMTTKVEEGSSHIFLPMLMSWMRQRQKRKRARKTTVIYFKSSTSTRVKKISMHLASSMEG